jgi:hypothetical protein
MSHPVMKDKAGHELRSGDYIVYGHNLDRSAALRYGIVIEIYEPENAYGWWPGKDKGLKKTHARIRGVDCEGWDSKAVLLTKDSTLQFGDRILRIGNSQMPEQALKLLSKWDMERRGIK